MANQNWAEVGKNISDMVQQAVESQDFSKLGDSINRAAEAVTRRQGSAFAPQNPWKGNGQFEKKTVSYMMAKDIPNTELYSAGGSTRAGAYTLTALGGFGCFAFGIAEIVLASVALATGSAMASVPAIIVLLFLGASIFSLNRGLASLGRMRRFQNYVRLLGDKTCAAIKNLAAGSGKKETFVLKDVRDMISRGMFRQGHVDAEGKNLFVTASGYEAYLESRHQAEAQKARKIQQEQEKSAYKTNEALSEDVKKIIAEGQEYIQQIHESNEAIHDEEVSKKLDDLEKVITRIFQYVEQNPQSAPETKKLMKYYLPTTIKLLDSYEKLGEQPVQGPNIISARKQIEETLDTLNQAFAKLFDNLYQDTSMDINSDISVLHTLLAQEGLTGEKM